MDFTQAVNSVLTNYAKFDGRARRPEYWYFVLFNVLVSIAARIVDYILEMILGFGFVGFVLGLALLVPGIAVGARRLHDTDRSGWWLLLGFIPVIGWIILIIWLATEGTKGENRFGPEV